MAYSRNSIIVATKVSFLALAFAAVVFGHDGFEHVIGSLEEISGSTVKVKTAKGNVAVTLNDKTEITIGDHEARASDLKRGEHVVIDVPEGTNDKVAHSLKVTAASVPAHESH